MARGGIYTKNLGELLFLFVSVKLCVLRELRENLCLHKVIHREAIYLMLISFS